MEISTGKPYREYLCDNYRLRTFPETVEENELIWHKDRLDRVIKVVEGKDWKFQFENQLPFELNPGITFKVPKETFHRIIKGKDKLILMIVED